MPKSTYSTTAKVTASVKPDNAANKKVKWNSDNAEVATVTPNANPATITAVGVGQCTVTVITDDGDFRDSVAVTVSEVAVTGVNATPKNVEIDKEQ